MIRLIKPFIDYAEVEDDFRAIFESGIFTKGAHVEALRGELAAYTGARHAYLMTSATTALWACLRLLGIGKGDEVIVSDFSFPATANVVEDVGATVVFADVSMETFNMLPEELERRITPRTRAVIFVDALGNPTGLTRIAEICRARGIPLIEDAACALGSSEGGRRCGSIADLTCFSFHPRKLVCTGEGGAITTDNDEWARWLDVKLNHGASGWQGPGLDFVDFGYNFRLPELQAVMGRKQLAKLERIVDERNAIREAYVRALSPLGFRVQQLGDDVRHNVQSAVFRVPEGVDRNALITALRAEGVESTIGTYGQSQLTFYRARYDDVQPNGTRLHHAVITLPCYTGADFDVEAVIAAVGRALKALPG